MPDLDDHGESVVGITHAGVPIQGRGVATNPANRFERLTVERDFEHLGDDPDYLNELAHPQTQYLDDTSRSVLTTNDSPDVGFTHSVNPYRGCSHGCVYCYARPTHEYLGFSAGLDFETKIMVKRQAPALLREALLSPRYQPVAPSLSGVTDCYQPAERIFLLTRGCLEVLAEFYNPASIITKNHLVTRDLDVLTRMRDYRGIGVVLSATTLDPAISRVMEPRTSVPKRRIEAIRKLAEAGIPVGVMMAPVVPGLTDHEMPSIFAEAARAGATFAAYVPLRLPLAVAPIFENFLETRFPDRAGKVLNRIRSLRGGKLNDANFGSRMRGEGIWAEQLKTMFTLAKKKAGITGEFPELSRMSFRRPTRPGDQLGLW